ncbi:MAG TPA: metal ABC transporter substrate-binding protein, partial [Dehalococcoidia bacterium]|nr:metal ABC transporter substrate-binding protein [Dehalococcoidia bacterium]
LVVANGLGLEGPALRVIEPNLPSGTPLLLLAEEALASGFSPAKPLGAAAVDNPHLWLDIDAAKAYAKLIADALAGVDPAGASAYDFNYRRFLLELDNLLQYVRDKVEKVPPQQRKLVTTHEAFPYLAAYLGLEQVAVLTPAPGQEPSPADLNRLKETLRREAIAAVFTEPQLAAGSSLLKEAAKETGARVCTLYSDSLDSKVRGYVELMRHNADEIARCLGEANG